MYHYTEVFFFHREKKLNVVFNITGSYIHNSSIRTTLHGFHMNKNYLFIFSILLYLCVVFCCCGYTYSIILPSLFSCLSIPIYKIYLKHFYLKHKVHLSCFLKTKMRKNIYWYVFRFKKMGTSWPDT